MLGLDRIVIPPSNLCLPEQLMSETFERIKAEIEEMLAKFGASTDRAEKQRLLKQVQLALEKASELVDGSNRRNAD